jgi:hypothetical protein
MTPLKCETPGRAGNAEPGVGDVVCRALIATNRQACARIRFQRPVGKPHPARSRLLAAKIRPAAGLRRLPSPGGRKLLPQRPFDGPGVPYHPQLACEGKRDGSRAKEEWLVKASCAARSQDRPSTVPGAPAEVSGVPQMTAANSRQFRHSIAAYPKRQLQNALSAVLQQPQTSSRPMHFRTHRRGGRPIPLSSLRFLRKPVL